MCAGRIRVKKYDKDCFELFRVFSDGMILQRESRVRIWGFANCGSRINPEISPETDKLVLKNCESFEMSTSAGAKDIPLIFDENEDKKWKQVSDVSVKDNTVVIKGLPEKVKAVRYCYDNCPYKPPIYDMNGLPASPFVLDVVSVL